MPDPVFTRTFTVKKHEILDNSEVVYAVQSRKVNAKYPTMLHKTEHETAVVHYGTDRQPVEIATVLWDSLSASGEHKDLVKLGNSSEWVERDSFWTKDTKKRVDSFKDTDGSLYFWHWRGERKVLTKDTQLGPVIADFVPRTNAFKEGGTLKLTKEAEDLGGILFVIYLCGESVIKQGNLPWFVGSVMLQAVAVG